MCLGYHFANLVVGYFENNLPIFLFVCLFGLVLYVKVNSYGHARKVSSHRSRFRIECAPKIAFISLPINFKTSVLGAQKNRLIETVLLSNHNICFG